MKTNEAREFVKTDIQTRWPKWVCTSQLMADTIEEIKGFDVRLAGQAAKQLRLENSYETPDIGKLVKICRQLQVNNRKQTQVFVCVLYPEAKKKSEFWIHADGLLDLTDQQTIDNLNHQAQTMANNYATTYNLAGNSEIYLGEENYRAAQKRFYNDILNVKTGKTWPETLKMLSDKFKSPTCDVPF
jgi:hypothetical protein